MVRAAYKTISMKKVQRNTFNRYKNIAYETYTGYNPYPDCQKLQGQNPQPKTKGFSLYGPNYKPPDVVTQPKLQAKPQGRPQVKPQVRYPVKPQAKPQTKPQTDRQPPQVATQGQAKQTSKPPETFPLPKITKRPQKSKAPTAKFACKSEDEGDDDDEDDEIDDESDNDEDEDDESGTNDSDNESGSNCDTMSGYGHSNQLPLYMSCTPPKNPFKSAFKSVIAARRNYVSGKIIESTGFRNFLHLFCRKHDEYPRKSALTQARIIYHQFSKITKNRFRDMNITPRKRASYTLS